MTSQEENRTEQPTEKTTGRKYKKRGILPTKPQVNMRDTYNFYRYISTSELLSEKYYVKIAYGFIKFMMRKIFEGHRITIPANLGERYIAGENKIPAIDDKGKIRNLAIDWKGSKELWEKRPDLKEKGHVLYHFNEHTNGISYFLIYDVQTSKVPNKSLYALKNTRTQRRTLPRMIEKNIEYPIQKV